MINDYIELENKRQMIKKTTTTTNEKKERRKNTTEKYFQAMFASSIPEIIELVGSGSKYSGELKREHGKRYP